MSETERNVEIIKNWFQVVWNQKDPSYIDEHFHQDGKAYGINREALNGPTAFRAFHAAMLAKFPDIRFEVEHCFGDRDLVTPYYRAQMTYENRRVELTGGGIVRMDDGKISEAWNLVNFLELMEQMAVVPEHSFQSVLQSDGYKLTANA